MPIRFTFIIFVGSLIVMTTACTWGWERFVKNHVYNCTDDIALDYLQPGQWIHHPVAVAHVAIGRSMSEPDTILQGWSVLGLWGLWSSLVLGSIVISFLLARLPCSTNSVKAPLLILFLLPLVFGSCATGDKRVSQETAIQEAVFRFQMAQRHADSYFLAVGPKNSDPSAAFLRRFANRQNTSSKQLSGADELPPKPLHSAAKSTREIVVVRSCGLTECREGRS